MITSVEVTNFRKHACLRCEVTKTHWLVGANGTGKTTILEAIDLATSTGAIASRISESDFHNADSGPISVRVEFDRYFMVKIPDGYTVQRIPANACELVITRRARASPGKALSEPLVESRRCIPVQYRRADELDTNLLPDGYRPGTLPRSVQESQEGVQVVRRSSGKTLKARHQQLSIRGAEKGFPSVFYFSRTRERQTRVGFNFLLSRITKDLNWRFRKGSNLEEVTQAYESLYRIVLAAVQQGATAKLFGGLRARAGQVGLSLDELEMSILNLEEPFSRAFLASRSGSNQIGLENMGSGVSLAVALCLLQEISLRAKEEVIFLIDEPELHLHPQLQQTLRRHLMASDTQVISSTHAPSMVSLGEPLAISRFDADGSVFPSPEDLEESFLEESVKTHMVEIGKYYRDKTVYSAEDARMLFAEQVLVVEGFAERFGLPILASLLGHDWTRITVVAARGKTKLPDYALICRAFGVPHFGLFDLDSEEVDDPENRRNIDAFPADAVVGLSSSFEDLFGIAGDHKASRTLEHIDAIREATEIPDEITDAIQRITEWGGLKTG